MERFNGTRSLLAFLRGFARYRWRLLGGVIAVPLSRLADLAITLVIGHAINRLQAGEGVEVLDSAMLWIGAYALAQGLFSFLQRWLIVSASRHFERELKQELFEKLTTLSTDFHDRSRSGDLVSRSTADVENLRLFLGQGLMFSLGGLVLLPVALVLLLRLEPTLALVMILPLVVLGSTLFLLAPRLRQASREVQEGIAELSHAAQESFAGIRIVKGYAREEQQGSRFSELSRKNLENHVNLARVRGLAHAVAMTTSQVTFLLILGIGCRAMIYGELGYGDLLVFVDLTLKLFWPIMNLGYAAGMYPRAVASAGRVLEILAAEPSAEPPATVRELPDGTGGFRLRGVTYTYPGSDRPALSDVDVEIPPGSFFGIVGPTGCGKTTLLHLLGRLREASGSIELDGVPLGELSLPDLRRSLGYVPQDSFLFSDTWRANVSFGREAPLSRDELEELGIEVCMAAEIERFPDGHDQLLGERGVKLSGGQRQRTCLARALAGDRPILILDGATSAVDTETEQRLLENLRSSPRRRTILFATHRLSALRDADSILVLAPDGTREDLGRHDELLGRDGWYNRTWRRQRALEELDKL